MDDFSRNGVYIGHNAGFLVAVSGLARENLFFFLFSGSATRTTTGDDQPFL